MELTPTVEGFWEFCQERESIRLKKEVGEPPPWTEDNLLKKFHFCNIRREHDRGTQYYLKQIVPEAESYEDLVWRTTLYRLINNVEWFENLGFSSPNVEVFGKSDWEVEKQSITRAINEARPPYSYAYIVLQQPDGKSRKEHLFESLAWMEKRLDAAVSGEILDAKRLREVWEILQRTPYVGPFISLQIYRDLILVGAIPFSDDDFVYIGPGARTGLKMIFGTDDYKMQYLALEKLRDTCPPNLNLNLGDIEHASCEFRKFLKLQSGGGRHRFYKNHNLATN